MSIIDEMNRKFNQVNSNNISTPNISTKQAQQIKQISNLVETQGLEKARKIIQPMIPQKSQIKPQIKTIPRKNSLFDDVMNAYENLGSGIIKGGLEIANYLTNSLKNNANTMSDFYKPMTIKDSKGNITTLPNVNPYKVSEDSNINKLIQTIDNTMRSKDNQIQNATNSISNSLIKKASTLTPAIGGMIPTIAASTINPFLGFGTAATSAGGQYIQDAKNRGATDKEAFNYASILGLAEGATDMLGIGALTKGAKQIAKGGIKAGIKSLGISAVDNAIQEAVMEPVQEVTSQVILKKSDWNNMPQRMLNSGIDGALVGTIMSGASLGLGSSVNIVNKIKEGKVVTKAELQKATQESENYISKTNELDKYRLFNNENKSVSKLDLKQPNTTISKIVPTNSNGVKDISSIYENTKLSTIKLPNGEIVENNTLNKDLIKSNLKIPANTIAKDNITMEDVNNILLLNSKGNYNKDFTRNLDDMAGDNKIVRDYLFNNLEKPLLDGKKNYANSVKNELNTYKKQMDELGIKKGSKESSAVQWLGEKQQQLESGAVVPYDITKLKEDFPNNWQNIVEAEKINRKIYDDYILKVNGSLEKVYPNLPNKQTVYEINNQRLQPRTDYYHHFKEMEQGFGGLSNILNTPSDISTTLVNKSEFTKPKSKFGGFLQQRKGGSYTADAVGGMVKYIPTAEYKVNIDPVISNNREFIKKLGTVTENTQQINKNIDYLTDFTNDLAGKTNPLFDRAAQKLVGRKGMTVISWLNNRVKSNAIVGNLNSVVSQFFNLPNATAYIKNPLDWANGIKTLIVDMTSKKSLINQSTFLKERYINSSVDQFNDSIISKPQQFAGALLELGDKRIAEATWYSAYNQYERLNGEIKGNRTYENAIDYADDITKRAVAGRGIGELPLTMKSKTLQLLAPFQVEVNNSYQLMKEKLGKKDALALLNIELSTYIMNGIAIALIGNSIGGFDFIRAIQNITDEIKKEDEKRTKNKQDSMTLGEKISLITGRLGGETISSMPYANMIGTMLTGGDTTVSKQLFGDKDPTRFGLGNIGIDAITTPINQYLTGKNVDYIGALGNVVTPWGGKQLSKTIKGAQDSGILPKVNINNKGIEYQEPINGSYSQSGAFRFAVDQTPENVLKALTLGSFSTNEGKKYLKDNKLPYSDIQTKLIEELNTEGLNPKKSVEFIEKIKSIDNDEKLKDISGAKSKAKNEYIFKSGYSDKVKSIMFDNILSKEQKLKIDEITSNTNISRYKAQEIYTTANDFQSDKDQFGNIIDGTQKNKVRDYILNTNISNENKQYIYDKLNLSGNIIEYAKAKTKLANVSQFTSLDSKKQAEVLETISNYYDEKDPTKQLKSLQLDWEKEAKDRGISFSDYQSYRNTVDNINSKGNTNTEVTVNWLRKNKTLTADQRQWIYAVDSKSRSNTNAKLKIAELSGLDVAKYVTYNKAISEISGKDGNGETVTNLRKKKVTEYVESLPLKATEKAILLYSNNYEIPQYRSSVAQYINKLKIDNSSKKYILENIGYDIVNNQITW